jgi:hypothetical protein
MHFFARLEAACADVVERTFAVAFPSELEPVQIARKLVAAFESSAGGRGGHLYLVRLSPADFARFEGDRAYLERQWRAMLGGLAQRSGRPQRAPEVNAHADPAVPSGMVAIAVESLPEPALLRLRVRKGMPPGASLALDRTAVIGRDASCDLVLLDPRVSRRHLEIAPLGAGWHFRDLRSSNGTLHNGSRADAGELGLGDVLLVGDSELAVEPDEAGAGLSA